jgi:hypothetical protein
MFPTRYFPNRFFAPRYWPKIGAAQGVAAVVHTFELSIFRGPNAADLTIKRSQVLDLTIVRAHEFELPLK